MSVSPYAMATVPSISTRRPAAALWLGALFACGLAASQPAAAQIVDSKVHAIYSVSYNGIHLGNLDFSSEVDGQRYQLQSNTKLKVPLLGSIFKSLSWRGVTKTAGTIRNNRPQPDSYHFAYSSSDKRGTIDMSFRDNGIESIERVPNKPLSSAAVPIERRHLNEVMDPMSAVMLISRTGRSHNTACARKIPIFDGEQRFNLALSYKRAVRITRSESGGYAGPVIVCRVRYEPIAGYKPNKKDIKFMAANTGIELWLMPLPRSRNYAPYRFVIPLPVGTATAELAYFAIRNDRGRRVALVRQ